MKNKTSVTARARVCAALASALFAFAWAQASAADSAGTSKLVMNFQATANSDLLVLGPVDRVEPSTARAQILGQWIPLSNSHESQNIEALVGHTLAVYGSVAADGSFEVAEVREEKSIDYVPGATHVYLKATISSVDQLNGTARIGSLSVGYSNALHSLVADDLAVGAVVSFSGLRFAENGKLYADNGLVHNAVNTARALGQTGSGTKALGQTGSGTLGQTGSGMLGQTGSGTKALGQTGSGMLGQTGSGTKALGQTGSGMLGQTGSGTKALGQTGSGMLGQTGSGMLGQTGSGTKALGQTGSGTLGQTGSGMLGQTGSGTKALGQTGSGMLGQTGSGTKALGQTGSGL
ncbi:MAG TPA: hypothetical protein VNZ53_15730 [Steroidobacteraceae bacterium]|nr:hypothetical protein [Steroidobacteraceae bacterium]